MRSPRSTTDWHVSTFVVNHHRTLSVRHVYVLAVVSDDRGHGRGDDLQAEP